MAKADKISIGERKVPEYTLPCQDRTTGEMRKRGVYLDDKFKETGSLSGFNISLFRDDKQVLNKWRTYWVNEIDGHQVLSYSEETFNSVWGVECEHENREGESARERALHRSYVEAEKTAKAFEEFSRTGNLVNTSSMYHPKEGGAR